MPEQSISSTDIINFRKCWIWNAVQNSASEKWLSPSVFFYIEGFYHFSSVFPQHARFARKKTSKNFLRAPRASFLPQIWRKTPFWGFWSDDTRFKKLFLVFFPLPVCCRRAQRAEIFVFSLGFFCWNGLPTKLEEFEIPKFSK